MKDGVWKYTPDPEEEDYGKYEIVRSLHFITLIESGSLSIYLSFPTSSGVHVSEYKGKYTELVLPIQFLEGHDGLL